MTRETKIGLLVGLAFIIVIGILLSDHLTSSTEPPQAALAGAGNNVRQAVANPGTAGPQLAPAPIPTNSAPSQRVPTRDELTPGPNPVSIVKVGPANNTDVPKVTADSSNNQLNQPTDPSQQVAGADAPTITKAQVSANPLSDLAHQHSSELELVDNTGRSINGKLAPRTGTGEYKAQAGDSLSKMAMKLMGSNTKANRDAIIAANASLKSDPNKVIVGKTYLIPVASDATAAPTTLAPAPASEAPQQATATKETGEYWYTVKSGDSLWKIASEQCGRAGAVSAIKELNKDILVGPDHDQVMSGTKLRLPSKPVAQTN